MWSPSKQCVSRENILTCNWVICWSRLERYPRGMCFEECWKNQQQVVIERKSGDSLRLCEPHSFLKFFSVPILHLWIVITAEIDLAKWTTALMFKGLLTSVLWDLKSKIIGKSAPTLKTDKGPSKNYINTFADFCNRLPSSPHFSRHKY